MSGVEGTEDPMHELYDQRDYSGNSPVDQAMARRKLRRDRKHLTVMELIEGVRSQLAIAENKTRTSYIGHTPSPDFFADLLVVLLAFDAAWCRDCNGSGLVSSMAYDGRETTYTCPTCAGEGVKP